MQISEVNLTAFIDRTVSMISERALDCFKLHPILFSNE